MNSLQNPIRIAWIDGLNPNWLPRWFPEWPAGLGLTIAPGKKGQGLHTTHDRDLNTDLKAIRATGASLLVNLMESDEMQRWHMHDYFAVAAQVGLRVLHFPIPDVSTPSNPDEFSNLVDGLYSSLQHEETIVIHCLGGLGRSGMLAACLLVRSGMNAQDAINLVRICRPGAIEAEQPHFVETYAQTQRA